MPFGRWMFQVSINSNAFVQVPGTIWPPCPQGPRDGQPWQHVLLQLGDAEPGADAPPHRPRRAALRQGRRILAATRPGRVSIGCVNQDLFELGLGP